MQQVIDRAQNKLDELDAQSPEKVKVVKIDGLTVLKIMKHSSECLAREAQGTLLGLDKDDDATSTLEVTNSFPSWQPSDDDWDSEEQAMETKLSLEEKTRDYTEQMMKMM